MVAKNQHILYKVQTIPKIVDRTKIFVIFVVWGVKIDISQSEKYAKKIRVTNYCSSHTFQ